MGEKNTGAKSCPGCPLPGAAFIPSVAVGMGTGAAACLAPTGGLSPPRDFSMCDGNGVIGNMASPASSPASTSCCLLDATGIVAEVVLTGTWVHGVMRGCDIWPPALCIRFPPVNTFDEPLARES